MLSSHRLVPPPSRVNNNAVVTLLSLTAAPWNHITTDPTHSPILHPLAKTDAVAAPPTMLDPALSGGFTSEPSMELDPLLDASLVKKWSYQKVGTPTHSSASRAAEPFREGGRAAAGVGSDVGASPKGSAATDEGWGDGGDEFDDLLQQHLAEPAADAATNKSGDGSVSPHSDPQASSIEQQWPTAGDPSGGTSPEVSPADASTGAVSAPAAAATPSRSRQSGSDRVSEDMAALGPSSLLLMGVSDEGHIWQWDLPWPRAASTPASGTAADVPARLPATPSMAAGPNTDAASDGPAVAGRKQAEQEKAGNALPFVAT